MIDRIKSNETSKIDALRKEIKACENIMKAQEEEIKIKDKKESNIYVLQDIKTSLDETIEKRVGGLEKKMESILDTMSENRNEEQQISYAQIAKKHIEAQSEKIQEMIVKDKEEERWIRSTSCNQIVHGIDETMNEPRDECRKSDKIHIEKDLLRMMGLNIEVVSADRIGVFTKERRTKNIDQLKFDFKTKMTK